MDGGRGWVGWGAHRPPLFRGLVFLFCVGGVSVANGETVRFRRVFGGGDVVCQAFCKNASVAPFSSRFLFFVGFFCLFFSLPSLVKPERIRGSPWGEDRLCWRGGVRRVSRRGGCQGAQGAGLGSPAAKRGTWEATRPARSLAVCPSFPRCKICSQACSLWACVLSPLQE